MKLSSSPLSARLSRILNVTWYSGITISSVLFLLVCSFLVVTFSDFNVNVPTLTYQSGSYTYRFNNKYLHIIKNDELVKEYLRKEMQMFMFTSRNDTSAGMTFFNNFYKSLYSNSFLNTSIKTQESLPLMTTSYRETKYAVQFIVSFSILVLSYAFFGLMIIYNAKKILIGEKAENLFGRGNSEPIKFIGLYILLSEIVRVLLVYWMNSSTIKGAIYFLPWAEGPVSRSYTFSFSDFNYWTLFIGLIVVILAEVFRAGARLKEDVDLTI
ncbi:MAG: DUF2975 domain-containing protein [Syntrophomonadaceae bacterium]